jgi:hypothetical protein
MSPKSRGRKKKQNPAPQAPSFNGVVKDTLRSFAALGPDADLLDVEIVASATVGQWWGAEEADDIAAEFVDALARKATAPAAAALAGLRTMGDTLAVREQAAAALRAVVARGVPDPPWSAAIGQVRPGQCWSIGDVYGDAGTILCFFRRGEEEHGVQAFLDLSTCMVVDVAIVDNPGELLDAMRDQDGEHEDFLVLRQISSGRARRVLEDGIALADASGADDVGEDFLSYRAVTLARCRVLGDPEPPVPPEPLGDWEQIVDAVLAAEPELPDTPPVRRCVRLLIDYGTQVEPRSPLRVGPEKLANFLEVWQPGEVELTAEERDALPAAVLAWTRWGAARQELPEAAVVELLEVVQDCLDPATDPSLELYLNGDAADDEEAAELLDRRMFAVPTTFAEIGGEGAELDPREPESRQLLVVAEHPELHDALVDDDFDGDVDGVDPQVYLPLKVWWWTSCGTANRRRSGPRRNACGRPEWNVTRSSTASWRCSSPRSTPRKSTNCGSISPGMSRR